MTFVELTHVISRSTKVQCYTSQYVLEFWTEGYGRLTQEQGDNEAEEGDLSDIIT